MIIAIGYSGLQLQLLDDRGGCLVVVYRWAYSYS